MKSSYIAFANLKAEQALLGAILDNADAFHAVADIIVPEHFADPVHGLIYHTMARRMAEDAPITHAALYDAFAHTGELDEVGGAAYLHALLARRSEEPASPGLLARVVADAWMRRKLIDWGEELSRLGGQLVILGLGREAEAGEMRA